MKKTYIAPSLHTIVMEPMDPIATSNNPTPSADIIEDETFNPSQTFSVGFGSEESFKPASNEDEEEF